MKVTVSQINPSVSELDSQLENLRDHLAHHDSDFLLLPEMCFSDWLAADINPDALRWQQSEEHHAKRIDRLGDLGAKAILGTRPITKPNGSRRNQAFLWSTESKTAGAMHEKYYLPDEPGYYEQRWYERASQKEFDLGYALGMRIGVQICTEMWFFEWARHYARARADLLCIPRATPHEGLDKWLAGGQAAAVCSGAYCLSSNLWAPEGSGPDIGGMGWIIDPEGNVLATTDETSPFATVEIDPDFAAASKSTYPRYVPE